MRKNYHLHFLIKCNDDFHTDYCTTDNRLRKQKLPQISKMKTYFAWKNKYLPPRSWKREMATWGIQIGLQPRILDEIQFFTFWSKSSPFVRTPTEVVRIRCLTYLQISFASQELRAKLEPSRCRIGKPARRNAWSIPAVFQGLPAIVLRAQFNNAEILFRQIRSFFTDPVAVFVTDWGIDYYEPTKLSSISTTMKESLVSFPVTQRF